MLIKKLYKRTQTGAVQQWEIHVEGNTFYTVHGQQDGKKVTSVPTICEAKNVGRANATTAEEQAVLEAESKVRKQIEKCHYKEDIDQIDDLLFVKVMLATGYEKVKNKMTFDSALIQPKLDGLRWVCSENNPHSRSGKQLGGMNLIHGIMLTYGLFEAHPELVMDGEGYTHKYKDNFAKMLSLIKRDKIKPTDAMKILGMLEYHVYDCLYVNDLGPDDPYLDRMEAFWDIIDNEFPDLKQYIKKVPYFAISNHDDIQKYHDEFVVDGYEGAIVRYDRGYEQKRSKWLIKVKEFQDAEFEIIEIQEGNGNRSKMAGNVAVWLDESKTTSFGAGIKGGEEFYKELWDSRYDLIGKTATIRFFGRYPDTNIPRFPVCVAVAREDYE